MVHKNGGSVVFHFKGDTSQLDKSLSGLTSKIAVGNLIAKGVSKAFQVMSNSMDDAMSRVDTMNNFPNVMKNLGISTKESEKAIRKISKGLEGLPTTLDAGASAVQRFTSANGNIKKSTNMFLALNNALLAGGASTEIQATALEQLSQAYAKGKPDMMEWRSLQTAMPAQLKQVASAFNMTSSELGEALRNGSISMDDFMNKIIELNKNGTGGFASFEEQAKNSTNGLRTNITNLKTAIVRGMADAFNSINTSLKNANLPSIQQMIKKLAENITKGFKQVNKVISKIDWQKVIKAIKILIPIVATLLAGLMAYKVVVGILNAVAVAQALLNAVMLLNPIGLIVAGIVMLITILVILYKKCTWFRNIVKTIFQAFKLWITTFVNLFKAYINIVMTIITGLVNGIKAVFNFIKNNWKLILGFLVNPIGTAFVVLYNKCTWFRNIINGFVKGVKNAFLSMVNFIKSIPSKIKSVFTGMANIGKNMIKGLWNGAKNMKDWVIDKIKGLGKSILNGMKKVLGIKSPSKEFAIIGKFSMLGYEEGLEKMQPKLDKAINGMFNLSPSMTGTMNNTLSPNVNVVNNVNVETDPLGQVVSKIKTFSGGAKNDYNYGYGG